MKATGQEGAERWDKEEGEEKGKGKERSTPPGFLQHPPPV
jgi:hypothetical protein